METVEIHGSPISEIQNRLLSGDIAADDMFLVSTPQLTSEPIDRTYTSNNSEYTARYASEYMTYAQLSDALFNEIYGKFGIGSMISALSGDYSLAGHIHNYSKLSAYSVYAPEWSSRFDIDQLCAIMTLTIDGWSKYFYTPPPVQYKSKNNVIGQLKFMATSSLISMPNDSTFYGSSNFTGWVYPDGRSLSKSDFPDAFEFFGTAYGASSETFKIPQLDNFIKVNAQFSDVGSYIQPIAEKKVLSAHLHTASNNAVDGNIEYKINFKNTVNFSQDIFYYTKTKNDHESKRMLRPDYDDIKTSNLGDVAHGISKSNGIDSYLSVGVKIDYELYGAATIQQAGNDLETYPTHHLLPVLIYIGEYKGE